jgi:threonine synthase
MMRCTGCGQVMPLGPGGPWACPGRDSGDDLDHVLVPELSRAGVIFPTSGSDNPFVRYRELLVSYQPELKPDDEFVRVVESLDDAVAAVDGRRFRITPLRRSDRLGCWVKDETGNVAGSHKGRHLMGLLLHLMVTGPAGAPRAPLAPLAIASCGNAALAAAVIAKAAGRELLVFVPAWADPAVVDWLRGLGAVVTPCPRVEGQTGDPSYFQFRRAVAAGAVPFGCQGCDNGLTVDGGSTIGWELAAQMASARIQPDRVVVQVGGGALASAVLRGLEDGVKLGALDRMPVLHAVQTDGAWPLVRAYEEVAKRIAGGTPPDEVLAHAATHRSQYMWPWEGEPASIATGIIDDETYDWLAVVRGLVVTGGSPVVVDDATLRAANHLGREVTGIPVSYTGSAGLAGLLELRRRGVIPPGEQVVVLFTG